MEADSSWWVDRRSNGRFVNANDRWMEGDPGLVGGYVLMALSHCKAKK